MRQLSFKNCWGILLTAAFIIGMVAMPARAGVAVSPLKQEVTVHAGEPAKFFLTLSNNTRNDHDAAQSMHINIADVQVSETGALAFKEPGVLDNSASKWITLSQSDVTLEPHAILPLEFTVSPPLNAAPGEYYTVLLVTLTNKGQTDSGVAVQYRIASGVFVTVAGRTFPRQARITRCELLWPQLPAAESTQPAQYESPRVSVTLSNTGQARFDGSGKLAIFDDRAHLVFTAPLISKRPCIFGGDSRIFEAPITRSLAAGKYTFKVQMDYQSTWAQARQQMPVEILPEQANLFTLLRSRLPNQSPAMEVGPDKLNPTIPAGASRSFALTLKNTCDGPVHCTNAVYPSDGPSADSWITVGPTDCTINKAARKTVELKILVPPGTKPGKYLSTITIEGGPEGSDPKTLLVPVEIDVKSEK